MSKKTPAAKAPRNTLAMTIRFKDGSSTEIHMLNPGEHFANFGGSSRGVTAGKTASIITRTKNVGISDFELDIYAPNFWEWISRLINNKDGTVTAEMPGVANVAE